MKIPYPQDAEFEIGTRQDRRGRTLADAIALTAEVCGQPLSRAAAELLASDLGEFDENLVRAALARCRLGLQGPLRLAEIVARIDDGRPDADEAWTMLPRNESASVVWTDEMAKAWGEIQPLLSNDHDAARSAFLAAYAKAVTVARMKRAPVHWTPSLGTDAVDRERSLLDAIEKRRLTAAHVEQLLPSPALSPNAEALLSRLRVRNLH